MKILVDNYKKVNVEEDIKETTPTYPRKCVCENCSSELEYEKSDLRIGAYGAVYLDCPCCGRDNLLDSHEDEITLTADNIEFPTHFHRTSTETGAVDMCNNEEIKKLIQSAIKYFRKNKDEHCWDSQCGNLYLSVRRYSGDEDYEINVTNNYYSTYIPFQSEDY